jgi:hypothetical protein
MRAPGAVFKRSRCRSRSRIPQRGAMLMLLRLQYFGSALLRSFRHRNGHTNPPHQGQALRALRGLDPSGFGTAKGLACAKPICGLAPERITPEPGLWASYSPGSSPVGAGFRRIAPTIAVVQAPPAIYATRSDHPWPQLKTNATVVNACFRQPFRDCLLLNDYATGGKASRHFRIVAHVCEP